MDEMLLGLALLLFSILLALTTAGMAWLPLAVGVVGLGVSLVGFYDLRH